MSKGQPNIREITFKVMNVQIERICMYVEYAVLLVISKISVRIKIKRLLFVSHDFYSTHKSPFSFYTCPNHSVQVFSGLSVFSEESEVESIGFLVQISL